ALIAINIFTIGALPLAAGGVTLILLYLQNRVHKHFNEIAWDYVDQIRKFAHVTTAENQKFANISLLRAYLMRPEFKRLDSELKLLDEEIRKFREVVLKSHGEDQKNLQDSKQAFINFLEGLQREKLAPYLDIEPLLDEENGNENDIENEVDS